LKVKNGTTPSIHLRNSAHLFDIVVWLL